MDKTELISDSSRTISSSKSKCRSGRRAASLVLQFSEHIEQLRHAALIHRKKIERLMPSAGATLFQGYTSFCSACKSSLSGKIYAEDNRSGCLVP
jgi:hypothetical protein